MQALAETMMKWKAGAGSSDNGSSESFAEKQCRWDNERTGDLDKTDGYDCKICKNKGYTAVISDEYGYETVVHKSCECQKIRKSIRIMQKSGLKDSLKRFDQFIVSQDWQRLIKETAMDFVKQDGARCFYIGGQSGAGKTHICTAISREYMLRAKPLLYVMWLTEIDRLKSYEDFEDRTSRMKELTEIDVLYIDDFFKPCGKQPLSRGDIAKTMELIDRRYKSPDKITIISSELTLGEVAAVDQATAGRIFEMAKGEFALDIPKGIDKNFRKQQWEQS